jgi:hypothetical protein
MLDIFIPSDEIPASFQFLLDETRSEGNRNNKGIDTESSRTRKFIPEAKKVNSPKHCFLKRGGGGISLLRHELYESRCESLNKLVNHLGETPRDVASSDEEGDE